MSAPDDGNDEDERTNIDAQTIDPSTFPEDTSVGAPPVEPAPPAVSRTGTDSNTAIEAAPPAPSTTTDTDPSTAPAPRAASGTAPDTDPPIGPPIGPPKPAVAAAPGKPPTDRPALPGMPATPPSDRPSQPAIGRTLTPIPAPPRAAGALLPPAIARTKTPVPAVVAPPPKSAAPASLAPPPGADEVASPAVGRTTTARDRTKMQALDDDGSAQSPPAIARTKTPGPPDAREKTPVPAPPRTSAADAARERTKTPAPAQPIASSADDDSDDSENDFADPDPAIANANAMMPVLAEAREKTPVPTAPRDTASAPAGAREKTPVPTAPRDTTSAPAGAREKTPVPTAPREKTPVPTAPRDATSAPAGAREKTPVPTAPREKTPVPTAPRDTPPAPASAREKTPVPTAPREKTPVSTPPGDKTPVPINPSARAPTPIPSGPARPHRASTNPPTTARPHRASTNPPTTARPHRASTNPPTTSTRAQSPGAPSGRIDERSEPTASTPRAEPWLHRIVRIAPWLIIAAPALFQVFLLSTAISGRLLYPYDLEWMEGGMLHHAQRIHGGLGIYVEPSIEFIPYLYTPLYPSLLALFGGAFGISYTLGRAFSVIALIGIAVVAAASIASPRHEHARRAPAYGGVAIALGLFAAAYPYMEGWYDLVRADTFFLFMVTAAIAGLPRWAATGTGLGGHGRVGAGAVLLALAFFCKQTGIIYVGFGGLIVLVVAWRRVPIYVLMAGLIGLGGTWLLQRTTDGWFWVYIKKIHAAHDFNWDRFWKSFENILWHVPAMTMVIGAGLIVVLVTVIWRRKLPRATHPLLLWSSTFVVSTLLGAIGWGTEFAHFNAYMPAFLHGALAAGAAIPAIYGCARLLHGRRKGSETVSSLLALAAAAPLALACWENRWDPQKYMPTARDVAAGDRLIERIRAIEGDVWMPSHPWYLVLAGKSARVHRMGVRDVTWRQPRTIDGLEEALRHHAFAALILDGNDVHNAEPATTGMVNASYRAAFKLPADERPRVYTGARVNPDSIWLPARPALPPKDTRVVFDLEQAAWDGWTVSGTAWGPRPETELSGHGLLFGASGRKYATSMHGGDVSTGRVTSPAFVVDGTLSIKLGGGTDATKLRVELWVGGAIVATASAPAPGGETLRTVTLDPGASRGLEATLVFVDDSPAGHLDVDDVWLTP